MKRPGCKLTSTPKNKRARRNEKRKQRRERNKVIRERKYERPFDWNPQFQPKVMRQVERKRRRWLKDTATVEEEAPLQE